MVTELVLEREAVNDGATYLSTLKFHQVLDPEETSSESLESDT